MTLQYKVNMSICIKITSVCVSNWQAVDALKQLYLEFPRLYNDSVVCSFMPDVVYKVMFPKSLLWIFLVLPGNLNKTYNSQFQITFGLLKLTRPFKKKKKEKA